MDKRLTNLLPTALGWQGIFGPYLPQLSRPPAGVKRRTGMEESRSFWSQVISLKTDVIKYRIKSIFIHLRLIKFNAFLVD
ncbi:MAG: hypothetical protein IIB44_09860 [Candidatus Marinimicrobia bacterium]|nr:hypothetical protein [Candidatus Neomarinimicrobiota bacterium]